MTPVSEFPPYSVLDTPNLRMRSQVKLSTPADLKLLLERIAHDLETHKDHLCELDSEVGDGDHGVSMTIGMRAIRRALREFQPDTPLTFEQVWRCAAEAFADDVGASIGPLYEAAFNAAADASRGKASLNDLSDWAEIISQMAASIQATGKAKTGDKTMVDAWAPAATAIQAALKTGSSLPQGLQVAAQAARYGALGTRGLLPKLGRASRLGERARTAQDAGATSAALILESLAAWVSDEET